jgi:hypothetical protein
MEVTIMQIVCMAVMEKCNMPTMLSMDMGVLIMSGMTHQKTPFSAWTNLSLFLSIPQKMPKINYKFIIETLYHYNSKKTQQIIEMQVTIQQGVPGDRSPLAGARGGGNSDTSVLAQPLPFFKAAAGGTKGDT